VAGGSITITASKACATQSTILSRRYPPTHLRSQSWIFSPVTVFTRDES